MPILAGLLVDRCVGLHDRSEHQLAVGTSISGICCAALRLSVHDPLVYLLLRAYSNTSYALESFQLVAQQQCVGPFHTPIADYAVVAQSYFDIVGVAISIGEQPIKGLINIEAMVRMTIGEMLTNLMFVKNSWSHFGPE